MDDLSKKQDPTAGTQPETGKEKYEPLTVNVVDVKVEKGYASSTSVDAPQWDKGSW